MGGNLISFTIDGTEYQAEDGMTWGEWVDSEYNTAGCYKGSNRINTSKDDYYIATPNILDNNSLSTLIPVNIDDLIIAGNNYSTNTDNGEWEEWE